MKVLSTYIMLGILSILSLVSTDIYLPLIANIAQEFNCEISWIQFSISLYIFVLGIGQLLYGAFADRFGFHVTFFTCMGIYFIGSIICAQSETLSVFLSGRVIQALGASAALVSWQPLLLQLFEGPKAKSVGSILFILMCLSPGFAPVIGALVAEVYSWRITFCLLAFYAIILSGLVALIVPVTKSTINKTGQMRSNFYALLNNRSFMFYLVLIASFYSGYLAYLISYPILIGDGSSDAVSIGLQFAPMATSFCIGALISKRLMQKNETLKAVRIGLILYTIALLLLSVMFILPVSHLVVKFLPAFCLLMFGSGILLPSASFEAILTCKELAHSASGLIGFFRMCIAFIATGLLSLTAEHNLFTGLILMLFVTCATAWVCFRQLNTVKKFKSTFPEMKGFSAHNLITKIKQIIHD